jgi:programmed cell death protein 5
VRELEDIDEIRQRKMAELQKKIEDEKSKESAEANAQMQKQMVLRAILTPEARSRLTNLRLSRPEYANTIEVQLINLAQSGNLRGKVTDLQLKDILRKLARQRTRNTTIKRV